MAERSKKSKARTRGFAPSGDIESMEKMEASDEAKAHKASDVDAMGQDKRRQIVGHAYGPSRKSQVLFFVIVAAILVVLVGGYALAISAFDQPPDEYPDQAKWSQAGAEQIPTHSPSRPCGEPGNPYPVPAGSPCESEGVRGQAEPPGNVGGSGKTQSGSSNQAEE